MKASLQSLLTFSAVKIFDLFFIYLAFFFLNISYQFMINAYIDFIKSFYDGFQYRETIP